MRPCSFQSSAWLVAVCLSAVPTFADSDTAASAGNWPSFRGEAATGISSSGATPTTWNVESGESVRWKTTIPGLGHSCPVIWGDRIFLTTAVGPNPDPELKVGLYGDIAPVQESDPQKFTVVCLNKKSGEVLWQQVAHEGVPKVKRHTKATHANSTPATDGKHVVAFFGSEGLYCYDVDGKLLWSKDFGLLDSGFYMVPQAQWGFGSSPVIFDGRVVVQCDVQSNSFLAAFDVRDGRELWRTERTDVPTWSTPTVHRGANRVQVIVNGYRQIAGYDFETGKELWTLTGGGDIPVPTPVVAHDLAFITNAHGAMAPIYAIRLSATDDITPADEDEPGQHLAWWTPRKGNYMQTPLVVGDYLYGCTDNGILTCLDARTGEQKFRKRLGEGRSGFTASGVSADGKLYFTSEEGDVYVLRAAAEFEELGKNALGEVCMATPAISDGTLYFRTQRRLIAIGQ